MKSRWEEFTTRLKKKGSSEEGNEASDVKEYFPFHVYFSNAPQPIFKGSHLTDFIVLPPPNFNLSKSRLRSTKTQQIRRRITGQLYKFFNVGLVVDRWLTFH